MKRIILALSIITCGLNTASSTDAAQTANPDITGISVVLNLTSTTKYYKVITDKASAQFTAKADEASQIPLQGTLSVDALFGLGKKILDQDTKSVVVVEWPDSRKHQIIKTATKWNIGFINNDDYNIKVNGKTISSCHSINNYCFFYLNKDEDVTITGGLYDDIVLRKQDPLRSVIHVLNTKGTLTPYKVE